MAAQSAGQGQGVARARHILCYGDNLTFGFCSNGRDCKPYAAPLSEAFVKAGIHCKVSVGGLSGNTARQMVEQIDHPSVTDAQGSFIGKGLGWILREEGPFDLCIIMAGTNDLTLLSRSEDIVRDVRSLHTTAHKHRVPTVAIAPPSPQQGAQTEIAKLLADWVQTAQHVLTYADAEAFVPRSVPSNWEQDNVHLSPAGSASLGQHMMEHLLPVISYLDWGDSGEAAKKAIIELAMQKQRQGAQKSRGAEVPSSQKTSLGLADTKFCKQLYTRPVKGAAHAGA